MTVELFLPAGRDGAAQISAWADTYRLLKTRARSTQNGIAPEKCGKSRLQSEDSVAYRKGACLKFRHRYVCAHTAVPVAYIQRNSLFDFCWNSVQSVSMRKERIRRPEQFVFLVTRGCHSAASGNDTSTTNYVVQIV